MKQVYSANEKTNESEENSNTHGESNSPACANGSPQRSNGVPEMSAEHKAAIQIQAAFRAYMV